MKDFADGNFKSDKNGRVLQKGRKHCRKRRNCSLQAIYSFLTVLQQCKNIHLFVNHSPDTEN